jgi:hypothetical protein
VPTTPMPYSSAAATAKSSPPLPFKPYATADAEYPTPATADPVIAAAEQAAHKVDEKLSVIDCALEAIGLKGGHASTADQSSPSPSSSPQPASAAASTPHQQQQQQQQQLH